MIDITELQKAFDLMGDSWQRQNNLDDSKSKFIYETTTVNECLEKARINNVDVNYALHRFYNYHTSKTCEQIFVQCGATAEANIKNREIDIYISNINYDVKLTVYPAKLECGGAKYNLTRRQDKNLLAQWLYCNQSQEDRKHLKNRIFIVCTGNTTREKLAKKMDFEKIKLQTERFFAYCNTSGFNRIIIHDNGKSHTVYSDIIVI